MKQLTLIWFSGIIRGAIAFALSLQINTKISPNASLLVSSTLVVVLTTTLLFGGMMSAFARIIGINREKTPKSYRKLINNSLGGGTGSNEEEANVFRFNEEMMPSTSRLAILWDKFDEKIMRPTFIRDDVDDNKN